MLENFIRSTSKESLIRNRLFKQLLPFFDMQELMFLFHKYGIGTAQSNEPAFWYFENNKPKAVEADGKMFFAKNMIWNIEGVLSFEQFTRIGITSTPEDAFLANLYLRNDAIWISFSPDTNISLLTKYPELKFIAILKKNCPLKNKLQKELENITITEEDNLTERLLEIGKPMPFFNNPKTKHIERFGQWTAYLMKNPIFLYIYAELKLKFT